MKFLGLPIQVPHNPNAARSSLQESLEKMLKAVDGYPVTWKQKLRLYKQGICPRLTWSLTVHDFPLTWVERCLEASATRYLTKWSGLAVSANPSVLYFPKEYGGLGLSGISTLYKRLQVFRHCQLLTFSNPTVRRIAEKSLKVEDQVKRKKFRPALVVWDTLQLDPSMLRKALRTTAKHRMTREDADARLSDLQSLPRQGHMSRTFDNPRLSYNLGRSSARVTRGAVQICTECCT